MYSAGHINLQAKSAAFLTIRLLKNIQLIAVTNEQTSVNVSSVKMQYSDDPMLQIKFEVEYQPSSSFSFSGSNIILEKLSRPNTLSVKQSAQKQSKLVTSTKAPYRIAILDGKLTFSNWTLNTSCKTFMVPQILDIPPAIRKLKIKD